MRLEWEGRKERGGVATIRSSKSNRPYSIVGLIKLRTAARGGGQGYQGRGGGQGSRNQGTGLSIFQ